MINNSGNMVEGYRGDNMILYKYRDISGNGFVNTQDIFVNRKLYLSELKSLNDPNESIAEIQINNQLKVYGNLLEERNRKMGTRIFSLSETHRSSLMWSHYAASHTGICIAFDFSDWEDTDSIILKKVRYVDSPIKLPHIELNNYAKFAEHKEASWSYEKEWRFISQRDKFLNIDSNIIKVIFLGARFDKVFLQWVKYWRDVYNPNVEIRQMNFVTCSYELFDDTELGDKTVRM